MRNNEYRRILADVYTKSNFDQFRHINGRDWLVCYYCGNIATDDDHIPPLSLLRNWILEDNWEEINKYNYITVPSCGKCNRILHDKPFMSPEARKDHIQNGPPRRVRNYKSTVKYPRVSNVERIDPPDDTVYSYLRVQIEELIHRYNLNKLESDAAYKFLDTVVETHGSPCIYENGELVIATTNERNMLNHLEELNVDQKSWLLELYRNIILFWSSSYKPKHRQTTRLIATTIYTKIERRIAD